MTGRQNLKRKQSHKNNQTKAEDKFSQQTPAHVVHLQNQIGNQAIQRMLVQGEGSSTGFNPLDPAVIRSAASTVIAEKETPVYRWLDANLSHLRELSMGQLVATIRRDLPEATSLANAELESLIQASANRQGINILREPRPTYRMSGPELDLPEAIKNAFSIATEGFNLVEGSNGQLNISVSGATVELGGGSLNLNWKGRLGIDIPIEGFRFGVELSRDSWKLTLSVGGPRTPDIADLTRVFREAEAAMRSIARVMAEFDTLDNASAIQQAINPYVEPIKNAITVLQDIAESPTEPGVDFDVTGVGFGPGHDAKASRPGSPMWFSLSATLTIRF